MNYPKDNFSVPTLTLSGSRARRQLTTIPTKDYPQIASTYTGINQNDINLQNRFVPYQFNYSVNPQDKTRRPPIFPPKITSTQNESRKTSTVQISCNNLNKNVYLQRKEDNPPHNAQVNSRSIQMERNFTNISQSSLRKGLLTDPISDHLIQQRVSEKNLERKRDINKTLFDRKLNKLFEQANFYNEQLLSQGKDELAPRISQLQKIKDANLCGYRTILSGLNALIQ